MPLFAGIVLAERIERAEAQLMAGVSVAVRRRGAGTAGFVLPIAGGVASFAEEGSPFNKVAGLGFGGVPSVAALGEIERTFAARGAPVQIELSHLADPAIGALLTGRGYRLVSFENVLGRALEGRPERVTPPGVEVRPSGEDELEAWLGVVVDASLHSDAQGVPSHEEFPREVIARAERDLVTAAGVRRYAALRDGVIVGGASFRLAQGVAQFTGAATAPAHRRRGRHRGRHHPAGVQVSAERAAPRLRPALYPCRPDQATLSPHGPCPRRHQGPGPCPTRAFTTDTLATRRP